MVWICAQKAKYCKWEVAVQEEERKTLRQDLWM